MQYASIRQNNKDYVAIGDPKLISGRDMKLMLTGKYLGDLYPFILEREPQCSTSFNIIMRNQNWSILELVKI